MASHEKKVLKTYSLDGSEVGDVRVEKALFEAEANGQMVKDYIAAKPDCPVAKEIVRGVEEA